ncbi:MAG TPA: alkaline phosphatase family protein [Thermoleophilaceae bacterium]|nr:alkaline phosphatase family protein [Thermoleophilaceae bacterium]
MAETTRREFLERTAYTAGLAGMAAALPANTILAEAAAAAARGAGLPSPRNLPIDHFVVLMMENRSFDHYFGWVPDADGIQQQSYTDPSGAAVPTRHFSTLGSGGMEYKGCGHPDPGHGWESGRAQLLGGFLADGSGNDEFALTYFNSGDLGFIHEAARNFTLYDRYFCSLLASTWPNRYYKWSAQSGGLKNNDPPLGTAGNQWETIFDRAIGRGVTARYYASDLPFSAVWGPRGATWTNPITRYYADCAAGTLPNISFVDPPFRDGGGGDGLSADEHPLGDVRLGQAFMADVVNAFVKSPNYRRGALFVIYDEWGGFFDHVTPPSVPDDRSSADLNEDFGQMGFRIPALAVSPWSRGRRKRSSPAFRVDHGAYGHESILKLISYRFGLGDLNLRMAQARNVGVSFDWDHPDFDLPALPDPPEVATAPCALGGGDVLDSQAAHEGDLAALEALAEQFGVPTYEGKLGDIFTLPDTIGRAVTAQP